MTASADYGVSIIENFAPPKQWVPGEEVKKEEAVVNTGSVDAFVKQTISGVLTVTVEVPSDIAPDLAGSEKPNYITLDADKYGSIEAGSYIAYSPNADEIGRTVIQAFENTETAEPAFVDDFAPSTTGLYIFRRAIDVAVNGQNTTDDISYEYVGYYYVADSTTPGDGTYYKLYSIDENTLDVVANGDLASAPSVRYSKETTKTLKNVPMTYEGSTSNSRLVVEYYTDQNADTSVLASLDRDTFNAYRNYINKKLGMTTWDSSRRTGTYTDVGTYDTTTVTYAKDPENYTGLTDYDEFDGSSPSVLSTLANWSLERLTTRATETASELDAASPSGAFTETNWNTEYNEAKTERTAVNKGQKAAQLLATLRDGTVIPAIGTGTYGLTQDTTTYPFNYSSVALDTTDVTPSNGVYAVQLLNDATHVSSTGLDLTSDPLYLTADNMDMDYFQDPIFHADGTTVANGTVFGTSVRWNDTTRKNPYGDTASGSLKTAWDNYVFQTKRKVLIDAKLALLNTALTTTDVAQDITELTEYKELLTTQQASIAQDLQDAQDAYEAEVAILQSNINQLNAYQDLVNKANEVSKNTTTNSYGADPTDVTTYPAVTAGWRSDVFSSGSDDTGEEAELAVYLKQAFGIAEKDVAPQEYAGDTVNGVDYSDTYINRYTYSPTETQARIDANYESIDGVITQKGTVTGYTKLTGQDKTDVEAAPYYENKKVNYMKDYRQTEVDNLKAIYDNLLSSADAATQEAAQSVVGPLTLYVNLANLDETPNDKDKWQYIADATGPNEYNFYYTGILQSGETSSLLIKSVEMPDTITQDMFRNLQFDLNVVSESAQVTYEGDTALSTAANATITGANTTLERYAQEDKVAWVADNVTTEDITDNDPNPKASVDVDGTTYTVQVEGTDTTVTKVAPVTIDGETYRYQIVDGTDVYYGKDTASGTEFKKVADPDADTLTFADPAVTKTLD